ncbi:MAG TPA: rRNA maturation RNase YbeY [Pyrinomonadaceae bacterium]|jgi:rRNA maturation RNase YbeY|nr:rRNA maturation RNase YbeY [Pyrinomonadaceae bacterium]
MVEIVNRQRTLDIDLDHWHAFTEKALKVLPKRGAGVTVAFVSDQRMRALNKQWRNKTSTTDVLSFPAGVDEFESASESTLGDVIISIAQATRQAANNGLTLDHEIAQLILHGLLHLCGYDHETDGGEMNRLEIRLRRRLAI